MSTSGFSILPDSYFVLGVRQDATPREIEDAYRKALNALPAGGFSRWFAEVWFNRSPETVWRAYQTLSDPMRRQAVDEKLKVGALQFLPPY